MRGRSNSRKERFATSTSGRLGVGMACPERSTLRLSLVLALCIQAQPLSAAGGADSGVTKSSRVDHPEAELAGVDGLASAENDATTATTSDVPVAPVGGVSPTHTPAFVLPIELLPPDPALTQEQVFRRLDEREQAVKKTREDILGGGYLLSYVREVYAPSLLIVNHLLYAWDTEHMRLEIKVLDGQGKSSLSLLNAKKAALKVEEQWSAVNASELKARLNTYRLENLLRLHLSLGEHMKALGSRESWVYMGQVREQDGSLCPVLGLDKQAEGNRIWFIFDPRTWSLRHVIHWSGGEVMEFVYSDVRVALPGLALPFRLEHRKNGRLEDLVRLQRLEVMGRGIEGLLEPDAVDSGSKKSVK